MAQSSVITKQRSKKALKLAQAGKYEESIHLYLQVSRTAPNNFNAAFMLGALYGNLENFRDAARFSRQAAKLDPNSADALYNLAQAEMHLGNTDAAISALQKVVELDPTHMEALSNLGYALKQQGDFDEAIIQYNKILALKHDHVDSLEALATIYRKTGDLERARKMFKIALLHNPDSFDLKYQLATLYRQTGEIEESLSLFNELITLQPDKPRSAAGKALLLEKIGDIDAALELLYPYVQEKKHNPNIAIAFSQISREQSHREAAIQYIKDTLANSAELNMQMPTTAISEETYESLLHFELGQQYDALGDYDDAFRYFHKYNESTHLQKKSSDDIEKSFSRIQKIFTSEFLAMTPVSSIETSKPIFIVGMPRSGTTLTEQILSSHPSVVGGGELTEIFSIANNMPAVLHSRLPYPECMPEITRDALDQIARRYLDLLNTISPASPYVTDKMPHNFAQIGLIRLMFPTAKIIHCVRNPLDNCLSIYFNQFNSAHNYAADLTRLGEHYKGYCKLMAHWNELFAGQILEHRYENIIADQEGMTRRLLEFCNLEWDPACMQFFKSKRVVSTISHDQVRQPIYKKSVARWRRYEKHLQPLIDSLGLNTDLIKD